MKTKRTLFNRGASYQMETKRTLFNKRCNMLDEIRHEQSAMEDAIPPWEWEPEYEEVYVSLAKEKAKIIFGGEEE
jgi:hypothetical protein